MTIEIKCGEKYEFNNIKKVIEDSKNLIITGNFKKREKNKEVLITKKIVGKRTLENFILYLRNNFRVFDYKGACPFCGSDDIIEKFNANVENKINIPKPKYKIFKLKDVYYKCLKCKKTFEKEKLIEIQKTLYY